MASRVVHGPNVLRNSDLVVLTNVRVSRTYYYSQTPFDLCALSVRPLEGIDNSYD